MAAVGWHCSKRFGYASFRKLTTGLGIEKNLSGDELLLKCNDAGIVLALVLPYFDSFCLSFEGHLIGKLLAMIVKTLN